jgi:hypothetical protein
MLKELWAQFSQVRILKGIVGRDSWVVDERKSVVTGAPEIRNNSAVFERGIDVTQKRIARYVLHVNSILNGIVFE